MCRRPAVSTSTRSAPRLDAAAIASNTTEPGSAPSWPRTSSPPVRSAQSRAGRRRRRGTCRPPPSTTRRPSPTCCAASLPIVVVFPTPLTPTNIHTLVLAGDRAATSRLELASRIATTSSRTRRDEPVGIHDVVGFGTGAHRVEDALGRREPDVGEQHRLFELVPGLVVDLAAAQTGEHARERGCGCGRGDRAGAAARTDRLDEQLLELVGGRDRREIRDLELRGQLGFELRDRLVDRRLGRRWRPRGAAGSPGATGDSPVRHGARSGRASHAQHEHQNHGDDDERSRGTMPRRLPRQLGLPTPSDPRWLGIASSSWQVADALAHHSARAARAASTRRRARRRLPSCASGARR